MKYTEYLEKTLNDYNASLNTLVKYKNEMQEKRIPNGDNIYHRLAMCENAQAGREKSSWNWGIAKELADILLKTPKVGYREAVKDSIKDIKNNFDGISLGLQNPEKDCRILLRKLNKDTNSWEK